MNFEFHLGADYPVLREYIFCRARFSLIRGPRASGKTFGSAQRILLQACEQQPNAHGERLTRTAVIRATYRELMSTTLKDFLEVVNGLGTMKYGGEAPPMFHLHFRLEDGTLVNAEVYFVAVDGPGAEEKIKGLQLTWGYFSEMSTINKSVLDVTTASVGRYPSEVAGGVVCTQHGVFGDTNSYDESHWLYHLAEVQRPEGWRFFRQPGGVVDSGRRRPDGGPLWVENPKAENLAALHKIDPNFYLRLMDGKADDWIRVMLANEYGFTVDGMPVHPEYVDSVHCAVDEIEPDEKYPLIIGVDFGRTPAAAICQFWEKIGRWVVIDEMTSENMSAELFGPQLKLYLDRRYGKLQVRAFGDPAGDGRGQNIESTPIDILRAKGIPIQPAPTNNAQLRRAALAGAIRRNCLDGRSAFLLSPRAKQIRKGLMGGWSYRRIQIGGQERYHDEPDKGPLSHCCEALEYALAGGGEMNQALRPAYARPRQSFSYSEYNPLDV